MTNVRLELKDFAVGYGKEPLLSGLQLTIEEGKIVTLIGPNGSGKSTILKTIIQQLKPMGGELLMDGKYCREMSGKQIARKLSMVMTDRPRTEWMTCREMVESGRYPYVGAMGILGVRDHEIVDRAMEQMHITPLASQAFDKLSDGQKQRVMLARAFCQETDVMVLDEPTSYLDMHFKLDILENIRRMAREQKKAILMSLHELDLAMKISDTIVCVAEGRIVKIGSPEEVFQGEVIAKLYGVSTEQFNEKTGAMYLKRIQDKPRIFVIGGGGSATGTYFRLQREGIAFVAGILAENDVEYEVARACAGHVISTRAFYPITDEKLNEAKKWMEQCEGCICTLREFGPWNKENEELWEYAKARGIVWQK